MQRQKCSTGSPTLRQRTRELGLPGQAGAVGQSSALVATGDSLARPEALEAAGGIGGLLAVAQTQEGGGYAGGEADAGNYVYAYDGNGNVVQVLDWAAASAAAAIVAKYEYDPYGNVVASGGDYAVVNPLRFSTKYWDDETGLGYWGYRYYSSRMGRWISRDPIGEEGGFNLYHFVRNSPIWAIDASGASETCLDNPISCGCPPEGCPVNPPPDPPGGLPWPPHEQPPTHPPAPGGWKPGWLWGRPRSPCIKGYDYPDSDWTAGIKVSSWGQAASQEVLGDLAHALRDRCAGTNCCERAGAHSTFTWSESRPFNSAGADWWHIGRIHLTITAICNTEIACSTCKFNCSITRQFWDSWHWDLSTRDTCALSAFNWYLSPTYSVQDFEMPCEKKDAK